MRADLELLGEAEAAPNSNLPPFDTVVPEGADANEIAKQLADKGSRRDDLNLLGIQESPIVAKAKPILSATPKVDSPLINVSDNPYDPVSIMGKMIVSSKKPTNNTEGAMLALNRLWGLAKNPYDAIKGTAEFVASVPGFIEGVGSAAWGISRAIGKGADFNQAYDAASKNMEETSMHWKRAVVDPLGRLLDTPKTLGIKAAEAVTGKKIKTPEESYSDVVGEIAMAPLNLITKSAHAVADAKWMSDYPNAQGVIKFGGDVLGLLTLGRIYKGGHAELAKDVEPLIAKAKKITEQEKVVETIPDVLLKKAQEKVLEVEKAQLELEAKALQDKIDHKKVAEEDLKAKGQEVQDIKDGKDEIEIEPFDSDKEMLKSLGYEEAEIAKMSKEEIKLKLDENEIVESLNDLNQPEPAKSGIDLLNQAIDELPVETKAKGKKVKKEKKAKVVAQPEPITDLDLQTGTPLPEKLKPANHPFRDKDAKHTETMKTLLQEKVNNVDATPEVFTRYLINEVNRYLNGEEVPIDKIRDGLSELATRADNLKNQFDVTADFNQWKGTVREAARWAREADRLIDKRSKGTQLNMMIPIDQLPEMVKDVLKEVKAIVGGAIQSGKLYRNKEVFDKTGYWMGRDGKWRYEVDDSKSKLRQDTIIHAEKDGGMSEGALPAFINNAELFTAVPELRNVKVIIGESNLASGGYYEPVSKTIHVGESNIQSTFIHELQHAVNDIMKSKFKGSNVRVEENKLIIPTLENMLKVAKSEYIKTEINSIIDYHKNTGGAGLTSNKISDLFWKVKAKSPHEYQTLLDAANKYSGEVAFENYMKDPGEMEARLSEKRLEMTAEERRAKPPWETLDGMLYEETLKTDGAGFKLYSGIDPTEATKQIIAGAKALAAYTAKARGMKDFKPAIAAKNIKDELVRSFVDRSGNIRKDLLDSLGDEGYEIIQKMYLSKGASSLAAQQLKQMRSEVYDGLTKDDKRILDNLILADRMLDIGKYKTASQFKFPEGLSPKEAASYNELFQFTEKITPEKADLLKQRAKGYFEWMKKPLKDMLDAELISQVEYDALASHNYRRLKLIDVFDKRYTSKVGKTKRTVYDSGVEALSHGRQTDVFEPSSEVMALEVFNRAYGRILNNAANKTLLELARSQPDNPFAAVKEKPTDHIPSGWDRVFVYEQGERKAIYLSPEMSKEWITNSPEMSYKLSQIIRYASGSPVLRTFATGIDWAFALANLPRDIMHIWYASRVFEGGQWKPLYNSNMPVYFGQMGADISGVFHDAVLRKGRYQDYIKEGGGMEFLVHQGRLMQRGRHIEGNIDKIQDFLGYFGETSEILTRLAVRDRVIKRRAAEQGLTYEEAYKDKKITQEATFAARDYMDFGQGGGVSKALDNGLPYLNASIQGTRGLFRSFKNNKAESAYKLAQFAALTTGLYIANQSLNPETTKALKGSIDVQSNMIIPLGDSFGFDDEKGQRRYPYIKIPLDPGQKFFKMFFEASYDKATGQQVDVDGLINSFSQVSPVSISSLPPTVSGTLGYMYNKDFWLNDEIWKKTDKPLGWPNSKEEYIPGKTPQAFIDAGAITGLSPERLKYALSELVTGGSMWSWLVGQGYDAAFHDLPKEKKEFHLAEVLSKTPVIKRFIGITNPYSQFAQPINEAKEDSMLKRWVENRGLDQRVESFLYEGGKREEVIDYIQKTAKDQNTMERLRDRFVFQEKIKELPNRSFWLSLKGIVDTEARAKVFVERFDKASPADQAQMNKEIGIVTNAGGVISDEFKQQVMKVRDANSRAGE